MTRKWKITLRISATVVLMVVAVAAWAWKTRAPIIREIALDLKAGAGARGAQKQFERFIELRYGPMDDPANRQKVFLGFFDTNHIEGMRRLVGFMKPAERQTNIAATADWIANYRDKMSAQEREALASALLSEEGRARIQRASALYRSRDIAYRSATEPVIRELMTTLTALQGGTNAP